MGDDGDWRDRDCGIVHSRQLQHYTIRPANNKNTYSCDFIMNPNNQHHLRSAAQSCVCVVKKP